MLKLAGKVGFSARAAGVTEVCADPWVTGAPLAGIGVDVAQACCGVGVAGVPAEG